MNRLVSYFILSVLMCFSILAYSQDSDSLKIKTHMTNAYQSYKGKDYQKCREYCLKAIEIDSTNGEAYILIGSAYVSVVKSCAKDYFSQHMIYCLAVDKFQKAREVDKSVAERADKMIRVYSKYFPSREGCWVTAVEGEKFKVNCWINEETTVRFSK